MAKLPTPKSVLVRRHLQKLINLHPKNTPIGSEFFIACIQDLRDHGLLTYKNIPVYVFNIFSELSLTIDVVNSGIKHRQLLDIREKYFDASAGNLPRGAVKVLEVSTPEIIYIKNFLSPKELNALNKFADSYMAKWGEDSGVQRDEVIVSHKDRKSKTAWLGPDDSKDFDALYLKLRKLHILQDSLRFEPLQLVDYEVGGKYDAHYDDENDNDGKRDDDMHRVSTALLYLKSADVDCGGKTTFPLLNLEFSPSPGDLLLFSYGSNNDIVDPLSLHSASPIKKGTKRIITLWANKH